VPGAATEWYVLIEDEGYRKVLQHIEQRRSINEVEAAQVLGSARKVRAFSRALDELLARVPFSIEIRVVGGLKTYQRRD
jgi:hypothetical protein